ncbi:oxidoreductase [Thalassotalea sp. 42_200_T64]|nr:oxidoreductase [Thalassotalea sp. 42_200_T64]
MTADNCIKAAIVGYGFSAKTFHIPFITTLAEFQFSAISSSQRAQINQDHPGVEVYDSAEQMLKDCDAEVVIITAPNDVHFQLAKLALLNNKHVVLEKPIVTRVSDGEQLIALAQQKQKVLTVYHNRRWDGDFLTVKKLINQKSLGHIRYYESHFDRFRPQVRQRWRETAVDGGGILYDLAPHMIDQALQLFGKPTAITAQCVALRDNSAITDLVHLVLFYPDKLVVLHASLFCASVNLRFQLQGDCGNYVKHGLDPQEDRLRAGILPDHDHWADEAVQDYGHIYRDDSLAKNSAEVVVTERGGYQHFFHQLATAINDGEPVPVSAEDALLTIKLIELAQQSSQTGQKMKVQ